jgi:hypothetical protein
MTHDAVMSGRVWMLGPGRFRAFLPIATEDGGRELVYKDCGSWADACAWLREHTQQQEDTLQPPGRHRH